ncbi:hypothetical protein, partial [Methylosinus sp. 3S-1]
AAGAPLPAAAMAIPPALPDALGGAPIADAAAATLVFIAMLDLAAACGALVLALIADRIERGSR